MVPEPQNDKKRGKEMKRYLFIIVTVLLSIGLVACSGDEVEEKEVDNVDLADQDDTDEGEKEEAEDKSEEAEDDAEEEVKEIDEEVVDNEDITARLISVEKIVNKDFDEEKYEIKFEVENKRDTTIEVQAREVSADSKMIDESMLMMSQEISGGKSADAVLTIQSFEDDLPEIEKDLDFILHVFDWDDYEFELDVDVNIDF